MVCTCDEPNGNSSDLAAINLLFQISNLSIEKEKKNI